MIVSITLRDQYNQKVSTGKEIFFNNTEHYKVNK